MQTDMRRFVPRFIESDYQYYLDNHDDSGTISPRGDADNKNDRLIATCTSIPKSATRMQASLNNLRPYLNVHKMVVSFAMIVCSVLNSVIEVRDHVDIIIIVLQPRKQVKALYSYRIMSLGAPFIV